MKKTLFVMMFVVIMIMGLIYIGNYNNNNNNKNEIFNIENINSKSTRAFNDAQYFVNMGNVSKKSLEKFLSSGTGVKYSEEEIQYALNKVKVNYQQEAIEAALSYKSLFVGMSKEELKERLIKMEGFTEEQVSIALDE